MEILDLEIVHSHFANQPDNAVVLHLDTKPVFSDLFTVVEDASGMGASYWRRNADGFVQFYRENRSNRTGFGGAIFPVPIAGSPDHQLIGPWSSRPSVFNTLGFEPSIDISYMIPDYPHTRFVSAMVIRELQPLLERFRQPYLLVPAIKHGESVWQLIDKEVQT